MKSTIERALVIGIDEYDGAWLDGCVNDARSWTRLLSSAGVRVTTVTNKEATADRIKREISLITGQTAPCAIIYAGHGSQLVDHGGDEEDGLDECLCPVDFDGGDRYAITDDYIGALLDASKSELCVLVIDACHSGTSIRNLSTRFDRQVRSWPAPVIGASAFRRTSSFLSTLEDKPNAVLLAACDDSETALEAAVPAWDVFPWVRRSGGLWSYYLVQSLQWMNRVSGSFTVSARDWHGMASAYVSSDYAEQHPKVSSPHDFVLWTK